MNDAAITLAIPAYVKKQLDPLLKEIEALKKRVETLEGKGAKRRGTFMDRVIRSESGR